MKLKEKDIHLIIDGMVTSAVISRLRNFRLIEQEKSRFEEGKLWVGKAVLF